LALNKVAVPSLNKPLNVEFNKIQSFDPSVKNKKDQHKILLKLKS
jgi:hypothetical protein